MIVSYTNRSESSGGASIKGYPLNVDLDPVTPNAVSPDPRAPVTTALPSEISKALSPSVSQPPCSSTSLPLSVTKDLLPVL